MNKKFYFGAMALGLLLAGCQSEDIDPSGPVKNNVDRTLYVSMNIRGDVMSGSRAASDNGEPVNTGDFDPGENESKVTNAYFVFYDENGTLVGEVVKVTLPEATEVTDGAGTVEKFYQSVVPVAVNKGENDPTQVVCYINPITPASLQNPLNVIQTNTRDILYTGSGENKLFAMSNSVFYPEGEEQPQIAVSVEDKLFKTEAEAKAALEANTNVVDIYVERYAAKLQFTNPAPESYVTATSMINNPAEIKVTLDFEPKKWILNAACEESYIVKSFRQESATDGAILPDNYTFTALNSRINAESFTLKEDGTPEYSSQLLNDDNSWSWNNPIFHRSYWAMSPAYFTAEYPEVSSDVTGDLEENLKQHYYSYNELIGTEGNPGVGYNPESSNPTPRYFHETTVGAKALGSKNPAAAVASVILVGDYTVTVGTQKLAAGTTFYSYLTGSNGNPLVYFEADEASTYGASAVPQGESMLRRFIEQTSILFKAEGDGYVPFDTSVDGADMAKLVAVLEVAEPSSDVKGNLKLPERYRTLQFKDGADVTGIYVATTDGYKAIGAGYSVTEANQALMQQVGFCNMYTAGAGYFNIPVKHLGWYRKGNAQKEATKIDWSIVRVGDFGIVRNHSYTVNVSEITGLATGIGGKDSPIVPPSDTKDYFVAYRVNILKWAVVPVQTVKL